MCVCVPCLHTQSVARVVRVSGSHPRCTALLTRQFTCLLLLQEGDGRGPMRGRGTRGGPMGGRGRGLPVPPPGMLGDLPLVDPSMMFGGLPGPIILPGPGMMPGAIPLGGPMVFDAAMMDSLGGMPIILPPQGGRGMGGRGMMRGRGGRGGGRMAPPGTKLEAPGFAKHYYDLDAPANNRAVLDYGDL